MPAPTSGRTPLRATILLLAACATMPATAGLDVPSLLARHRALLDPSNAPATRADVVQDDGTATVSFQVGGQPATSPPLVGDAIAGGTAVHASGVALPRGADGKGLEIRLGATLRADESEPQPEGTRIGATFGAGEGYLSFERRHWGPGWFGSLILDGAAPPIAAAGWRGHRRYRADASWDVDLFVGVLSGHEPPVAHPKFIGMRAEWRPNAAWTLGAARTMQWGGSDRPENLSSFLRGLVGRDNNGDTATGLAEEPGNQMAALDARYDRRLDSGLGAGLYGQLTAEDNAGIVPSRRLRLVGADVSLDRPTWSLRGIVESARTRAGPTPGVAYRNHLYPAGYTHRGRILGHPVGGDARLTSLGLMLARGPLFGLVAVHGGRALQDSQFFQPGDRLRGADASIAVSTAPGLQVGVSVHRWQAGAETDRSAQVFARYTWP